MWRAAFFLVLSVLVLRAEQEFSPVISIDSPDTATTYPLGTIKHRALVWNDATQTLSAEVTFVPIDRTSSEDTDDTHHFRIPGITLDKARGIFYATSPGGEAVPVAQRKKILFLTTIEILPSAVVRVFHREGNVTVRLEAIRPSELAHVQKEQPPSDTNADGSHTIDLKDLLP